ncbi:MAG: hypothetical protein ACP5VN_06525, partial [Acidobacteriota bacterium]
LPKTILDSNDFGNSWTKLATNWPTTPITVYDLAISPSYSEAGPDTTLYAATSQGIYRWDGSTAGWSYRWRATPSPVYRVAVPPLYNRWGGSGWAYHGVFASTDDGVDNQVWFSRDDGLAWEILGYRGDLWGRVTGFAFAADFGLGARTELFVSAIPADIGGVGGVFYATYPWGTGSWSSRSAGLGANPVVEGKRAGGKRGGQRGGRPATPREARRGGGRGPPGGGPARRRRPFPG